MAERITLNDPKARDRKRKERQKRMRKSQDRATEDRAKARDHLQKRHPGIDSPVVRTASRWLGRTKKTPFSRVKVVGYNPAHKGKPGEIIYRHYTRKSGRALPATPENIQALVGKNLPFHMVSELTGDLFNV